MSEQVERRLYEILGEPTESPYGNPIPGLEALGGPTSPAFMSGVVGLGASLGAGDGPVTSHVRRLGELLQVDVELLQEFKDVGIVPGAEVTVTREGDDFRIAVGGAALIVGSETAGHVFLAA